MHISLNLVTYIGDFKGVHGGDRPPNKKELLKMFRKA